MIHFTVDLNSNAVLKAYLRQTRTKKINIHVSYCLNCEGKDTDAEHHRWWGSFVIGAFQGYQVCCSGHLLPQTPKDELLADIL